MAGMATGLIVGGISMYMTRDIKVAGIFAVVTIAGSLAPDLDCHSIPSRIVSFIGALLTGFLIYSKTYQPAAWIGCIFFIIKAQKHRGLTHSYFLPILCLVLFKFDIYPALPFGIGLMVHFILDGMILTSRKNWISI